MVLGRELVHLALADIQQFGDIGDGEGRRPPFERIGQIHTRGRDGERQQEGESAIAMRQSKAAGRGSYHEMAAPPSAVIG